MGSLAVAPSNDNVVYGGTGEGHLSGDSYFGNGILKSTDGGTTWTHVSGDYFRGVVDLTDRRRPGEREPPLRRGAPRPRRRPPRHARRPLPVRHLGVDNGGVSWTLLKEATEATGATDLEMDPQNTSTLYASFWGDAIYKSTNGGATWAPVMNGIPARRRLRGDPDAVLDRDLPPGGIRRRSVRRLRLGGRRRVPPVARLQVREQRDSWSMLPAGAAPPSTDNVQDYCGGQCFYDNIIEADPTTRTWSTPAVSSTTASVPAACSARTTAA